MWVSITHFFNSCRYESCIDAEIQQRAVEYFALSRKGAALMDILAEMPKFPERQVHCSAVFQWKFTFLFCRMSLLILNRWFYLE